MAGRVVAVGADVDEDLVGLRVVVDPAVYDTDGPDANPVGLMGSERDGGYAEFVTAPVERVHDVTGSPLTDDQLATLPTAYGTALGMIERGRLREGETVLVSGASGGVGIALVQIARARGARVLAVSSGSKIDAVREAGAHEVVDRAGASPSRSAPQPRTASTSDSTSSPGTWLARGCRCCVRAAGGSSPAHSAATT